MDFLAGIESSTAALDRSAAVLDSIAQLQRDDGDGGAGLEGLLDEEAAREMRAATQSWFQDEDGGTEQEDLPTAMDLVNQLERLSKRSPTGRLATALDTSMSPASLDDFTRGYDFTRLEALSRKTADVLRRSGMAVSSDGESTASTPDADDEQDDGGQGGVYSSDFEDFEVSATSSPTELSPQKTLSPNATADELVRNAAVAGSGEEAEKCWEAVQARHERLQVRSAASMLASSSSLHHHFASVFGFVGGVSVGGAEAHRLQQHGRRRWGRW